MHIPIGRIRTPVRREGAERYLLYTLLGFAGSVILTRLFLELTGYPQIAPAELHIAHVLWGGLLLFIASLLPLVLANRWAYGWSGILSGVGVGLFIDEVGKFITQTNDYFYPPAAPIIYTFFLLTVLLYLRVRREPLQDPRAELYRALDSLEEVLDYDLDPEEHAELTQRLRRVAAQAQHPDFARLAKVLLDFLNSESLHLAPRLPSFEERWLQHLAAFEKRWLNQRRFKTGLIVGMMVMGFGAFVDLLVFTITSIIPMNLDVEQVVALIIADGKDVTSNQIFLALSRFVLEGIVGGLLVIGAALMIIGRDRRGLIFSYFGLLLALTTVNLLVFYFDQFGAIIVALIQFTLLMGLIHYRRRYALAQHVDQREEPEGEQAVRGVSEPQSQT